MLALRPMCLVLLHGLAALGACAGERHGRGPDAPDVEGGIGLDAGRDAGSDPGVDAGGTLDAAAPTPAEASVGTPPDARAAADAATPDARAAADAAPPDARAALEDAMSGAADGSQGAPQADVEAGSEEPVAEVLLGWVLDTLARDGSLTSADVARYFAPQFLNEVPEPTLIATFAQLSEQLRPFDRRERQLAGLAIEARLDTRAGPFSVRLAATSQPPHQIEALWFQPLAPGEVPVPTTLEEAVAPLANLAREHQVGIAQIRDGSCSPILERNGGQRLAIGSAFKLWVLLALSQTLEADPRLSWASTLPIREDLKSLPSGVLQDQPAGTQISLDELASKMIAISDNTATDHLMDFMGRTRIEAAQSVTQHSDPTANVPWLMTRELFVLKTTASAEQIDGFRRADVPEKRALLDGLRGVPIDQAGLQSWAAPRLLDLEWFASPIDLCRVLAVLGTRGQWSPSSPLLTMLGRNSGIAFDRLEWIYTGFKGGSEPGVFSAAWLLQHATGAWFSVVVTLNDAERNITGEAAVRAIEAIMPLLASEASRASATAVP